MSDEKVSAPSGAGVKTAAQVLREAHGFIYQFGLAKGGYTNERGGYCAIGALRMAVFGDAHAVPPGYGDDGLVYDAAESCLVEALDVRGPIAITRWNDVEGRTADEVLAAFCAAASRAEGAESQELPID